jgi:hypothetical protein
LRGDDELACELLMLGGMRIEHGLGAQRSPCIDGRYDIAEDAFFVFVVRRKLAIDFLNSS